MIEILTEDDVLVRLFRPTSGLRAGSEKKSLIVATASGEQQSTPTGIERQTQCIRRQLQDLGISSRDNVVICCENRLEFLSTLLAAWSLNATTTLIDYRTDPADILTACKHLRAKLLFTSKAAVELQNCGLSDSKMPFVVLRVDQLEDAPSDSALTSIDFSKIDLDRTSLALFTSGTTGAPKSAMHSLRSLLRNVTDLAGVVAMEEGTIALTPLPVSHVFGLSVLLVTQVLGMTTVLTDLNPVTFIKAVHKHKPQLIAALPQFYGALLSAPAGVIDLKDSQLLLSGGAPLTVSLVDKFEEAFGKRLNNGYGSTESKIFALNKEGPVLSVGKAIGPVTIEIIDSLGNQLPEGQFGEVRVKSQTLMDGYFDNEEKTNSVLHGPHYLTGDYGRLEGGYLFVAGRKDDVVVVAGVVVHAAEVEEALRNSSAVKEVAVTAVANKRLGQVVKAHVVLMDEGAAKDLRSDNDAERRAAKQKLVRVFKAFCREYLPRYKRPMLWAFLGPHDDLPKTLAGKADKKAL